MSRDGDGGDREDGDATGSPRRSSSIAAIQETMPAPHHCSATTAPASSSQAYPETLTRHETGSTSLTAHGIAAFEETMPAPHHCSATAAPASSSQAYPETLTRHETGSTSSTAHAEIDEVPVSMTSTPAVDCMLRCYSGFGTRETPTTHEIRTSSSIAQAENNEAPALMTSTPAVDPMLRCYSGFGGRGLKLGSVPRDMLSVEDAVSHSIVDIWSDNVSQAFNQIRTQLQISENRCLVGMDTEFCRLDGIIDPGVPPIFPEAHYEQTRRIVDKGDLLQVGIAIGDVEGFCRCVYQFNIKFDAASRESTSPNVDFLIKTAKLDLDQHSTRGIDTSVFFQYLNESGILNNSNVCWVTYQGYSDFGYLIRGLENTPALPFDRREFLHLVRKYFPRSIDLKIFHMNGICCDRPVRGVKGSGSFQSMASGLRVNRLGEAHGAGSDAHLTLLCYHAMFFSNPGAAFLLSKYRNTIYGVDKAIPRPPEDSEIDYVEVWADNWNGQCKLISDMLSSNTCTAVGLAVNHELMSTTPIYYHTACRLIQELPGPLRMGFALSDHYGNICFRRIWILNLQGFSKDPCHIRHDQFATVLTQSGALYNPSIFWCSSSTIAHMCMLKTLTTAHCLPKTLEGWYHVQMSFFPYSSVLPLRSTEREGKRSLQTLRNIMQNPGSGLPVYSDLYSP